MAQALPQPTMSLQAANAALTAPDGRFPMREAAIRGQTLRVFGQIPATFADLFDGCRRFAAREYLVHQDERVTYDAFRRAVVALAMRLRADGVRPGDRVAIVMRNLPEWFVAFYAAVLTGAIATPLNAWWTGPELDYALRDCGAVAAIADAERLALMLPHLPGCDALRSILVARSNDQVFADARVERWEDAVGAPADWATLPEQNFMPAAMAADDDVAIFYTSGTTGRPKGAVASHRNILTNIAAATLPAVRAAMRYGRPVPPAADPVTLPQRVNLLAVPLFHATGTVTQLVLAPYAGTKVVMMRKWNPAEAVRLIERERVWVTGGVPTIAWQLLEEAERTDADLTSLVSLSYGGAPAAAELTRRIRARFANVQMVTGWGMTETMATVTSAAGMEYESHPASAGPPVPVSDVEIRDPEDGVTALGAGAVGELWVRGPQVVRGYWNRPEATAETFVDGWLRTGDLAKLDEDGFVTIVDRAKDMVIRGGENIYCLEVENSLYEHPDVVDAAVVGIPHPVMGEEPAAVVRLKPGSAVAEEALRAHVAARIARFKVPVRIAFLQEDLPRNPNGKVMKSALRTMLTATAEPVA